MRVLRSIFSVLFLVGSFLALATTVSCSGGGGGGGNPPPPPPTTGSMTLTVSGLPGSTPAAITISGPGNFNQNATGSATIPNLSPGSYTVNASNVVAGSSTYLGSPATQPVSVIAGQTVVATVTYAAAPISVSVSPTNPRVGTNGTVQLSAVVSGTANQDVTWSVEEGAAGGAITASGLYTAPATIGTYHARATSVADVSKNSRATLTVSALGGFHIFPNGLDTAPGGTWAFQALDDNTVVTTVNWSIAAAAGSVTPAGLFTASANLGSYTLTATNTATQQQATAPIHIVSNVTLSLYGFQDGGNLFSCDGASFGWELKPDSGIDRTVAWDMVEGAAGGSLLNMDWYRIYVASPTPGTYHPRATPAADPSKVQQRAVSVVANPAVGAFLPTSGAPATTRIFHGAAALPDGRVVLTGGWGGNPAGYLNSIEIFNPGSGVFTTLAGTLAQRRSLPVVVALDADRVLVCGGEVAYDSASNSGEIISAGGGTVTAVGGTMRVKRMGHQVTALTTGPNAGKFLITGGTDIPNGYGTVSGTADLFDPSTNTFTTFPQNMEVARVNHTATKLNDGRVLLVGGNDGTSNLSSAEIFDPVAGTFTYTTGHLTDARTLHTATLLLDGRVLIAGGNTNSGNPKSCEIFDPGTGNFTAGPDMQEARLYHTATRLADGRVLVIGGNSGGYRYHGTAEVYTPGSNSWAYSGRMGRPRQQHIAVLLPSGKVLVSGDLDNKSSPAAEISN